MSEGKTTQLGGDLLWFLLLGRAERVLRVPDAEGKHLRAVVPRASQVS